MIPREVVARVKEDTNLVGLVSESVKLRRRGKSFVGLCPFHQERTPSFHVNPKHNVFHCYGCNESGDAIDWAMRQLGMTFKEAVLDLASHLGIEAKDRDGKWDWGPPPPRPARPPEPILTWPESAIETFSGRFAKYLADRGVTLEAARAYGLGYDRENKRATFPVRRANGELVGLTGRSIAKKNPKYLHYYLDCTMCRAVPWIPRRLQESFTDDELDARFRTWFRNRLVFGAQVVASSKEPPGGWVSGDLFVVEGHVDAVKVWQMGHRAVATMGAYVSSDQGDLLVDLVPPRGRLIVLFDPDRAGRKSAQEVHEVIYRRVPLWNMELPGIRLPPGKVASEMSDDELDECEKVDPGNCSEEEFRSAYTKMTRLA